MLTPGRCINIVLRIGEHTMNEPTDLTHRVSVKVEQLKTLTRSHQENNHDLFYMTLGEICAENFSTLSFSDAASMLVRDRDNTQST